MISKLIRFPDLAPFAVHTATDIGERFYNQDAVTQVGNQPCFAVIDGMGGAGTDPDAGGDAARWIVATLANADSRAPSHAIEALNKAYTSHTSHRRGKPGDATLALIRFQPHGTEVAWAGDCAIVRVRQGAAKLFTQPHNIAGMAVFKDNVWTPEREHTYRHAARRNYVTRCLLNPHYAGRYPDDPNVPTRGYHTPAQPDDVYVLATDGAFDPLGTLGIGKIVTEHLGDPNLAQILLDAAGREPVGPSERDNRTVLVIHF